MNGEDADFMFSRVLTTIMQRSDFSLQDGDNPVIFQPPNLPDTVVGQEVGSCPPDLDSL